MIFYWKWVKKKYIEVLKEIIKAFLSSIDILFYKCLFPGIKQ